MQATITLARTNSDVMISESTVLMQIDAISLHGLRHQGEVWIHL